MIFFQRRSWLWPVANLAGVLSLFWATLLIRAAPDMAGPYVFAGDDATALILFTGKSALIFLVLSLACTPIARILGWRQAITVRKALGLWGFAFGMLHGLLFMGGKEIVSTVQAWRNIGEMLPYIFTSMFLKTPYARYGAAALFLLIPLALTSHRYAMRWLGKGWKWLHRLVYLAVPLVAYHYWQREAHLAQNTNLDEQPDYLQPALFALVIGLLLLARLPMIRRLGQQLVARLMQRYGKISLRYWPG